MVYGQVEEGLKAGSLPNLYIPSDDSRLMMAKAGCLLHAPEQTKNTATNKEQHDEWRRPNLRVLLLVADLKGSAIWHRGAA